MKLPENIHMHYEPVEINDVNLESLEGKLILVTGIPKRGMTLYPETFGGPECFTGTLHNGQNVIKLEATIGPSNAGHLAYNHIADLGLSISIGGIVRKSKELPNDYVLAPHFLYNKTKNGKETIIPFALIGPAIIDIKNK